MERPSHGRQSQLILVVSTLATWNCAAVAGGGGLYNNSDRRVTAFVHSGHGVGQLLNVVNSGVSVALSSNRSLVLHFDPRHEMQGELHGGTIHQWLQFFGFTRKHLPFELLRNSTGPLQGPGHSSDEICTDLNYTHSSTIHVNGTICHTMTSDTVCFWRNMYWNKQEDTNSESSSHLFRNATSGIHVAVHIRQGDIYRSKSWLDRRVGFDYFEGVISKVLKALNQTFPEKKVFVRVYSNGGRRGPTTATIVRDFLSTFLPLSQTSIHMQNSDLTIFHDLADMIQSDIFIGSKSQLSMAVASVGRGVSILPHWPGFVLKVDEELQDIIEVDSEQLGVDLDQTLFLKRVKQRLSCRDSN